MDELPRRRGESQNQRWDRNFADLLQELRVAQTGVQILFAFLLTLPFSNGFPKATAFQKDVYLVAMLSAAFAAAMIISPVAFHRALFRQGRKPELVRFAHRMATGGLGFMLFSVGARRPRFHAFLDGRQHPADHRLPAGHLAGDRAGRRRRRLVPRLLAAVPVVPAHVDRRGRRGGGRGGGPRRGRPRGRGPRTVTAYLAAHRATPERPALR